MKNLLKIKFLCTLPIFFQISFAAYAKNTAIIVDKAGFEYDYSKNIYKTKTDALQRFFGYNRGYDYMATVLSMVIDAEPIQFLYNNKWYMIELWKGQYYSSTGGEIGFYHQSIIDGHWDCANDEQMLKMSYKLVKNGQEIFSRDAVHWWLTGFKPGLFSEPHELSLENIKIQFKEPQMGQAFYDALLEHFTPYLAQTAYRVQFIPPNTVTFRWDIPRVPQDHLDQRIYYQFWNQVSANAVSLFMHPDYSPENFDKKLSILTSYLRFTPINVDNIHGFAQ